MSIGKVSGQEMLGISNSNFSGNMGMSLNPSLFVGSPYYSEFNFISGDFFVDNDYAFLKKRNGIFGKAVNGEPVAEESFGDYYNTDPKNAYGSVNLRGPSYIVNKPKHSWGFHTAFRSAISATDVPYHVAKFVKDGLDYTPQQGIFYSSTPFRSASAVWLEFGGTYGRKIHEVRDKGLLTAAVTLKVLAGMDGFYIKVDEFDYVAPTSDVLDIRSFTGEYGHALSTGENDAPVKPLKIRGWGGGADLGLTYYRKPVHGASDCNRSAEKLKKYQYRAGISIIDFGLLNFNKEAGVYSFSGQNTYWAGLDTLKFDSVHELDSALSSQFYGDPTASQSASSMKMYLPSAISCQFDYCIRASWYVNATLVHAVPLSKETGIVRSSQVAITPRYETREFEAAMPLTFYEYQTPHLGLAFRYRIFVLGTDRLGSFTGLWNTTGFDLFFGFKTNLCDTGGKKKKKPDCPAYSMVY